MTRIPFMALFVLATLCWVGPLGMAAYAQVDLGDVVDDVTDTVDDVTGAVDNATDTVGNTVGDTVETVSPGSAGAAATTIDQDAAIEAVESHRALPLEQIMTRARLHTAGEIVDAKLVRLNGFLLYELKVVEANGDVDELYFYALSGELVKTN